MKVEDSKYPETTKTCQCCLCGADVEVTVYTAMVEEEEDVCLGVLCAPCASEFNID